MKEVFVTILSVLCYIIYFIFLFPDGNELRVR